MRAIAMTIKVTTRCVSLAIAAVVFLAAAFQVQAATPSFYSADTNRVFWFIHASDLHIGKSGSDDSNRLTWLVNTGRQVIQPNFIVVTGDLTDSTNGNIFGYPNGPYQAEWDQYKNILSAAGVTASFYYDLPGNHDAYSDATFAYYRANAVQGRATDKTQLSWTRTFNFGTYRFVGANTADNTGASFSLTAPYGDHAGLDSSELTFVSTELAKPADLTLVFGHHPVTSTGNSSDTYLYYGHQEFIHALDLYRVGRYGYGHTHSYAESLFTGNTYTGLMTGPGLDYVSVASLEDSNQYSVVAIDCNGVSSVRQAPGTWPVVVITAPISHDLGGAENPYAYPVLAAANNPLRALVFDTVQNPHVRYRVDGASTWLPMTRVVSGGPLWQGVWDAAALPAGDHTIEVQAVGTTTRSHTITVAVTATGPVNHAPSATADSYATPQGTALSVPAPGVLGNDSDPDGDALTAQLASPPAHGALTLNADGSFTYTPTAGFSGGDTFTYVARDGTTASTPAAVAITVAATTDTVTILTATYAKKTRRLTVEATSSAQPNAALTVVGYDGLMTYNTKTKKYTYQTTVTSAPATVTVKSNKGGEATKTVTVK
jgi:VCBS repeat-containing protein